jgi:TonB family protein
MARFCRQCGTALSDSSSFCPNCGAIGFSVKPPTPPRPPRPIVSVSRDTVARTSQHPVAWFRRGDITPKAVVAGACALCLLVAAIFIAKTPSKQTPVNIVDGPAYTASLQHSPRPSPDLPVDSTDKVINVDATSLLAAYQADDSAANTRFNTKKVAVTGELTGVFVPSIDVSLRMAEKGREADAFVTMGGPTPTSVEQTLFLPGIDAYSERPSLFGQQNTAAIFDRLRVGETVTLVCTCGKSFRVSDLVHGPYNGKSDYSVTLEDCTLQDDSQLGNPSQGTTPTPSLPGTASNAPKVQSEQAAESAEIGDSSGLRRIGGAVSSPELIFKVNPEFSEEARKDKFNGVVLVNLIVDEHGLPQNVHVLRGVGRGLDKKAADAVRQYRFNPAMEAGKPVAVELNVEVAFQIF